MQLYQSSSAVPTRVRPMSYAKGIYGDNEPDRFHGDPRSKVELSRDQSDRRVPALVLDDGGRSPESEAICEYLRKPFLSRRCFQRTVAARRSATVVSAIGSYVVMAMLPLFLVVEKRSGQWDQAAIRRDVAAVGRRWINSRSSSGPTLCSGEAREPCRRHAGADFVAGRGVDADFCRTRLLAARPNSRRTGPRLHTIPFVPASSMRPARRCARAWGGLRESPSASSDRALEQRCRCECRARCMAGEVGPAVRVVVVQLAMRDAVTQ